MAIPKHLRITKQEKELLISIALGNRSLLTMILDHCDSSIRGRKGAHAMLAEIAKIRPKVDALEPITDPIKKSETPYWDLTLWW